MAFKFLLYVPELEALAVPLEFVTYNSDVVSSSNTKRTLAFVAELSICTPLKLMVNGALIETLTPVWYNCPALVE